MIWSFPAERGLISFDSHGRARANFHRTSLLHFERTDALTLRKGLLDRYPTPGPRLLEDIRLSFQVHKDKSSHVKSNLGEVIGWWKRSQPYCRRKWNSKTYPLTSLRGPLDPLRRLLDSAKAWSRRPSSEASLCRKFPTRRASFGVSHLYTLFSTCPPLIKEKDVWKRAVYKKAVYYSFLSKVDSMKISALVGSLAVGSSHIHASRQELVGTPRHLVLLMEPSPPFLPLALLDLFHNLPFPTQFRV